MAKDRGNAIYRAARQPRIPSGRPKIKQIDYSLHGTARLLARGLLKYSGGDNPRASGPGLDNEAYL